MDNTVALDDATTASDAFTMNHATTMSDTTSMGNMTSMDTGNTTTMTKTVTIDHAMRSLHALSILDNAMPSPAAVSERCVMDPDGDLLLRVGSELDTQTTDFVVCSATLRRSSPFWKKMLFSSWAESKPADGPWVVVLPEDNPAAFKTILTIMHGAFELVPENMAAGTLSNLLVLVDKYDLTKFLRPWSKVWMKATMVWPNPLTFDHQHPEQTLIATHVAWELGAEIQLLKMIKCLVLPASESDMILFRQLSDSGMLVGPPDLLGMSPYCFCYPT